jgi:transcriptional regulator with XRE-family HTH domain
VQFSDKLRQLRTTAGLTQEDLSERTGVPVTTIRGYEQGQRKRVTLAVATRLAAALGTDCRAFADCEDVAGDDAEDAPAPKPRKRKA